MATIKKNEMQLIPIDKECRKNWFESAKKYIDVSDFEQTMLRKVGDTLRQRYSQQFWCNGAYCWFTDDKQDHTQGVWLTNNGNCVFEDYTKGEIYNIIFK